jgi:hypothetical protein
MDAKPASSVDSGVLSWRTALGAWVSVTPGR